MNQFEALGLAYRALVGGRILVVFKRAEEIRNALGAVAAQARWISDNVTVVKTSAEERVEVGARGGEVVFTFSRSQRHDDYQADVVLTVGIVGMSDVEHARYERISRGGPVITR